MRCDLQVLSCGPQGVDGSADERVALTTSSTSGCRFIVVGHWLTNGCAPTVLAGDSSAQLVQCNARGLERSDTMATVVVGRILQVASRRLEGVYGASNIGVRFSSLMSRARAVKSALSSAKRRGRCNE
jgi:hypothetical protein